MSEGLIMKMNAEGSSYLNGFSYFKVEIILTKKGFEEYERVVEAVF